MPERFPVAPPRLTDPDRTALQTYFQSIQDAYEWLFSGVEADDRAFATQPHPFRNTLGFYYGHTAAFFLQKLRAAGLLSRDGETAIDIRMATGVWPTRSVDIADAQGWPPLAELRDYRARVHGLISDLIEHVALPYAITQDHPLWALMMGIEHEAIHFQTSIPLLRRTPLDHVGRPAGWRYGPTNTGRPVEAAPWVSFDGGAIVLGRRPEKPDYFAWDNELGQAHAELAPFEVKPRPVTNREFLDFVEDGGYRDRRLWQTNEGETWLEEMDPARPAAWIEDGDGGFRYRAIFDELEMPWDWPVEVNRHEAAAYAHWAGARLPSEAELHYLLGQSNVDLAEIDRERFNIAMRYGSPVPVGFLPEAVGAHGLELIGNVARWMRDDFAPLDDGFEPHPLYPDFSRPWFRGDHGVLLGAGFCAIGHMAQVGLMRDFMQGHLDQIAGITLARDGIG